MQTVASAVAGEPAGTLAEVQFCVTPRRFWQPKRRVILHRFHTWAKPAEISRGRAADIIRAGRRLGRRNVVRHDDGIYEVVKPGLLLEISGQ